MMVKKYTCIYPLYKSSLIKSLKHFPEDFFFFFTYT